MPGSCAAPGGGHLTSAPPVYEGFGRATWSDPWGLYRRLRDEDPVHRSRLGVWILTRFADVFEAARDTSTFSSEQGLTFIDERAELGLEPTIVMMDPPEHTACRRLVSRGFTPRRVGSRDGRTLSCRAMAPRRRRRSGSCTATSAG